MGKRTLTWMLMCICGYKNLFSECCEPIILKQKTPLSPEALMRSRYSAYVRADGTYLVYSSTQENQYKEDIPLIEEFAISVTWLKLDILLTDGNSVEFKAYYKDTQSIKILHEKSNFVLENNIWKYKDGELYNTQVQRNESCPCGSGKKFKKCCA